jgi:hypothetical protein
MWIEQDRMCEPIGHELLVSGHIGAGLMICMRVFAAVNG